MHQKKPKSLETWHSLNVRQQTYMRLIYAQDQSQERSERQRAAWDWSKRPAEEWRRITYGDTIHGYTPLKQAIKDEDLIDPGTGSTFKALADRGFIRTESENATSHPRSDLIVYVWLKPAGRKVVRDALKLDAPRKSTVGTLQEWHWRALAQAYAAGSEGLSREELGYARIGWNTWLRLRNYTIKGIERSLIEESGGIHISDFGVAYYERSYQRYCELYPPVEAVSPPPVDPHMPYVQEVQDSRFCRACGAAHLVIVTRTYQQDQRWIWSVQEQERHIPGEVKSRFRIVVEQCCCHESDIQEISLSFLSLLDRLATQNWRVRFPQHHWIHYLEYLVSGNVDGHVFYDPALVKQKLLPLLDATDREEDRTNIAREELHYCYNEHVGCGCVYVPSLGPFANVPVMIIRRSEGNVE